MDAPRTVIRDAVSRRAVARVVAALGAAAFVAGSLAVPALAFAAWLAPPPVAVLAVAAVPGVLAGLTAAVGTRRVESVREPAVSLRLFAVPVAATVVAVVAAAVSSGQILGPGLAAALLSALGLLVLRSGVATHHARRVCGDAEPLAALPEVAGRLPARRHRLLNVAIGLAWLAFAAASFVEAGTTRLLGVPTWAVEGALGAGFLAVALASGRSLAVTDAGVLVETPLSTRLYGWEEFAGYYHGDRLVLLRRQSWLEDLVFDRDAVSASAFAVIDESVPEREHRAVPAGDAGRRSDRAARER